MNAPLSEANLARFAFVPIYEQVVQHLRERILSGALVPGTKLPSEAEMAVRLGISRDTYRRSVQILEKERMLHRVHGKGTFVSPPPQAKKVYRVGLVGLTADPGIETFGGRIMRGVEDALGTEETVEMVLMPDNLSLADMVKTRALDGLIVYGPTECGRYHDELCMPFLNSVPHVGVCFRLDALKKARRFFVDSDNINGAMRAVEYLIGLGHTRIAHLAGPTAMTDSSDRMIGFRKAMQRHGLTVDESLVVQFDPGPWLEMAASVVEAWLRQPDRPSAIFAGGHTFALATYQAASTLGLRIPDDVSLVGFDDYESSAHLSPPLTTVRQSVRELGRVAGTMLLDQMVPGRRPRPWVLLDTELVIRQSCAPFGIDLDLASVSKIRSQGEIK